MMIQNVKKKSELENILGKTLMTTVLTHCVDSKWRRMPTTIHLLETKPRFHLDDSSGLTAYVVDLTTGNILAEKYCGSGDSTINYANEQLSEGGSVPDNHAVLFVERFWAGNKSGWCLTVVSSNVQKQFDK